MEIHVTHDLRSDTLQLPELRPLIGKRVEIIIRDIPQPPVADPWDALANTAGVLLGLAIALSPWRDLLLRLERRVSPGRR